MSNLSSEIKKATKKGDKSPEESFILQVVLAGQGQNPKFSCEKALEMLFKRILKDHWTTILKTVYIAHRMIPHMGPKINGKLTKTIFPVKECTTKRGRHHNDLIQTYIEFIRLNSLVFSDNTYLFHSDNIKHDIACHQLEHILGEFNLVLMTLHSLYEVGRLSLVSIKKYNVDLIKSILDSVLYDICLTYRKTGLIMDSLVENFYNIDKELVKYTFKLFKQFEGFCDCLNTLYNGAQNILRCAINKPELVKIAPAKKQEMKEYIKSLPYQHYLNCNEVNNIENQPRESVDRRSIPNFNLLDS